MEYTVPEELMEINDKFIALQKLRDAYVKLPFGYKKALKASIESENHRREFWNKLYDLYPHLRGKELTYRTGEACVRIVED